jgi:hypothetical protein
MLQKSRLFFALKVAFSDDVDMMKFMPGDGG